MGKIFIYGVPGSGKTTFSRELEKQLNYPVVEADSLRTEAQKQFSRDEEPFLYLPTTGAYRQFGEFNEQNVIKGFLEVRKTLAPYIEKEISKYSDHLIMEAAFLDPASVGKCGKLALIVTTDKQSHLSHFYEHRQKDADMEQKFLAARIIQNYLLEEAKNYPVTVTENDMDIASLIEKFISFYH